MSDKELVKEVLIQTVEAVDEIAERFEKIKTPEDFVTTQEGRIILDSICMKLLIIGEAVKKVDKRTKGELLPRYPQIPWTRVMGMRDIIAHHYFDLEERIVFGVCQDDLTELRKTLAKMLEEI
ncbi:MAG: DUF86 domain-containing protein [Candidatus Dadabacteria bacterium]|nr:DUF86 domain-containing protein [Candidatus Dadabacteria bacterium]